MGITTAGDKRVENPYLLFHASAWKWLTASLHIVHFPECPQLLLLAKGQRYAEKRMDIGDQCLSVSMADHGVVVSFHTRLSTIVVSTVKGQFWFRVQIILSRPVVCLQ